MVYLLDTNVVVAMLRRHSMRLAQIIEQRRDQVAVSAITAMELEYGAERSQRTELMRAAVDQALILLTVLDFDRAAARAAAKVRAELAALGTPIGPYDTLIAGHARSRGLTVVTHNAREYSRVPGLTVEDWVAEYGR